MRKLMLALLLLHVPLWVHAETRYIVDELTVPLRRGPSNQHKILHAGLPSGTPLEIVGQEENGFIQVRTQNGTDGYVPVQFLTNEPVAKDRLAVALKKVESLTAELANTRQNMKTEQGARAEATGSARELEKQVRDLQTSLTELRRVSANPTALYEENKVLKTQNAELQQTATTQAADIKALKSNEVRMWLLIGGGLVVTGLLFGVAIKSRPKGRSGW